MSDHERPAEPEPPKNGVPQVSLLRPGNPRNPINLDQQDSSTQGPNLVLLYGLLILALAAAIGFALMIVAPFYHRR
ncbi:MAG: hypothetical protein ABR991_02590 [Terracidiphilus sp.]|jgi:hypothetical protein